MSSIERTRLEERRERALQDIRELELQVADGEITRGDATRLRARYEAEAAEVVAALDALDDSGQRTGRSPRRVAAGVIGVLAILAAVTIGLVSAVEPRPEGGFVTGGVASEASEGVELSSVTNEQLEAVVADNPDVLPMRMALARRYLEDGDFSAALDHYLYVLEREDNAEALMYVGWMTHVSGDSATGIALLERSLAVSPGEPLAQWFLANALYHGRGDLDAAIPLLEEVIASDLVPPEVVAEAESMIEEASRQ